MSGKRKRPHEIKAFAAFDARGMLLYATIKPTHKEAREAFERFNPGVGDGYFEVLPIYIGVDKGYQYDIEDAINSRARPERKT